MKKVFRTGLVGVALAAFALLFNAVAFAADKVEALPLKPMADVVNATKGPVKSGKWLLPVITWPGDTATIHTAQEGLFKAEGLDVELFCENDVVKQVERVIKGDTAFFRGTHGMAQQAAEAFSQSGVEMVSIYNLTRSTGGDCMVVRNNIKSLADLKGKKIVLQLYGPHVDLVTTILARAGLKPTDVTLVFVKELTVPTYDTKGKLIDPMSVFQNDATIDVCMVISPDAATLTNNQKNPGSGGDGVEGSVLGAKTLFSTKSADHVIYDQYFVRKDFFDANTKAVEKLVHALMAGDESFQKLMADKASQKAKWTSLMSKGTDLLFGSTDTNLLEGGLGDCTWVGYNGNVEFYTATNTTRNFTVLTDEVQTAFIELGLLKGKVAQKSAGWDYTADLSKGLNNANVAAAPKPAFDPAKVQAAVEKKIATELDAWQSGDGTLYTFEVYFKSNQTSFSPDEYKEAFKKALEISQTLGGAVIVIEGHNSPSAIERAQRNGDNATIPTLEQAAKNVSYKRAVAVKDAFLSYAKGEKQQVDESQFIPVGMGAKSPKFPNISSQKEWDEKEQYNRRVVFRIKSVETELDGFKN